MLFCHKFCIKKRRPLDLRCPDIRFRTVVFYFACMLINSARVLE